MVNRIILTYFDEVHLLKTQKFLRIFVQNSFEEKKTRLCFRIHLTEMFKVQEIGEQMNQNTGRLSNKTRNLYKIIGNIYLRAQERAYDNNNNSYDEINKFQL